MYITDWVVGTTSSSCTTGTFPAVVRSRAYQMVVLTLPVDVRTSLICIYMYYCNKNIKAKVHVQICTRMLFHVIVVCEKRKTGGERNNHLIIQTPDHSPTRLFQKHSNSVHFVGPVLNNNKILSIWRKNIYFSLSQFCSKSLPIPCILLGQYWTIIKY